ncbi:MAG: efflux RND transporter permease subunit, partial [Epsilonproteobacteria bacterium]|nr:efflux RND transporter permease subunit [Campylobacterota bacterium]
MNRLIEYFIDNRRLNYALLAFLIFMGVSAYIKIPKEMFPDVELDKILVRGTYAGTSASVMDKMAVRDLEDGMSSIVGITKSETLITPGGFAITLTLDEHANRANTLSKVKDAISQTRQYLPSDMSEPTAIIMDKSKSLLHLSISSQTLSKAELIVLTKELKNKIARIPNINEVAIRGDSEEQLSIRLNSEAIRAYGLDHSALLGAISNLSYIYPIGNIEEQGNFVFISTTEASRDALEWQESVLKVGEKFVRLGDVASVALEFPQDDTLASFNGVMSMNLVISKGEQGNSMELSQKLRAYIEKIKPSYPDVSFDFYQDNSKPIEKRLNIVVSNMMFGLVLVFLSLYILINLRIAFIVAMGIPFSFIIGLLFIYYMGYTINIVSLLGALIVIGIVVDDAIVVSENIQRHIDEGMEPRAAAITGVKEMILPVTLATVTTVVAFLPMFMLKGEISLFLILIPIVVVMILLGSLLESFLFLPLHAVEFLKKSNNLVDWTGFQELYARVLSYFISYKKTFLLLFLILIPIATFMTMKSMKFQFFPNFDGNNLYISGKMDINTPLEETYRIAGEIERELM